MTTCVLTRVDLKRALVTEVVFVTETVANVVVYVDENGSPYLTSTMEKTSSGATATSDIAQSTLMLSPAPAVSTSSITIAPAASSSSILATVTPTAEPSSIDVQQDTSMPVVPTSAVTSSSYQPPPPQESVLAPPTQSSTPSQPSSGAPPPSRPTEQGAYGDRLSVGITYDPFAGSQGSSRCKTEQEIASEFEQMKEYKIVRIYGMGCNIIPLAVQNAVKNGQKLMAGVYMSNRGNSEDLGNIISTLKSAIDQYASGNWDLIQLFSVENERVNDHDMTASEVVDAIRRARGQLRGAGYNGPVGAVETVPATIDNPAICEASDVVMVNCHAFFDSNTKAQDAGTFVKSQVERVQSACNSKRVVVTESGWPHQGDANGAAVPSLENQRIAVESLRNNFDHDMFLFNAFDSNWKSDWASSFNAERFWGVIQ